MTRALPVLAALTALAGCMPAAVPTSQAGLDRAVAAGAPQAVYDAFPAQLFAAHSEICSRPGEEVVRPTPTEIRCEMLLPVEMTGGLILEFDGTVEDLPRMIIGFVAQESADGGWLVTSDNYIRVPQRAGGVREVRLPDPRMRATMEELFAVSGGRPI